ncbi:uncharacterized protein [Amphiura filiformis]|uniref:uncharacterized protein n=1 Tax=Amphiura filiformis TaxID=82378 RepID=UPI003B2142E6
MKQGDIWINDGCSKKCSCDGRNKRVCDDKFKCGKSKRCGVNKDGIRGCYEDKIPLNDKKVWQSSTYPKGDAKKAIDGNTAGNWNQMSCSHTQNNKGAWWVVDISKKVCVGKVVIYNRKDCCKERLANAVVRLGPNKKGAARKNPECGVIKASDIDGSSVLEVTCNMKGRYLSVNLPGKNYLQLCEVEAYPGDCGEGQEKLTSSKETKEEQEDESESAEPEEDKKTPCQKQRAKAKIEKSDYVPECKEKGEFKPKQCKGKGKKT